MNSAINLFGSFEILTGHPICHWFWIGEKKKIFKFYAKTNIVEL